ncbi:MAG: nicotinamidase [Bacteroidales bacterium]
MDVLLIVDVQNDFCPGGALAAPRGNEVVPVLNNLMNRFEIVLASKDWHPENSVHFENWPVHCVKGTKGAELHPELKDENIDKILLKGTEGEDDGYSAFEATNVDLVAFLKEKRIKRVYIGGLTTEYCIKETALSSVSAGFDTYVIEDAIRPVNVNPGDGAKAIREMKNEGVKIVNSANLN